MTGNRLPLEINILVRYEFFRPGVCDGPSLPNKRCANGGDPLDLLPARQQYEA
jgi:hypothetical protein